MNRQRLTLFAAILISFVAGGLAGGAVAFWKIGLESGEALVLATLANSGNEAYVRYRYGSYGVAKAALLRHAELVERSGAGARVLGNGGAALELGLTYGRLAEAAQRAGLTEESSKYMRLACEAFERRGQPVGDSQVRASVAKLDVAWDTRLAGPAE